MNKVIVITSIFPPTQAVRSFAGIDGYELIVVGDKKTPPEWRCENVQFISIADQQKSESKFAKVLPYNHYSRKMIGYLQAIQTGAEVIVDTDDDNIPKADWAFPGFEGTFDFVAGQKGFVNIYQLYSVCPKTSNF